MAGKAAENSVSYPNLQAARVFLSWVHRSGTMPTSSTKKVAGAKALVGVSMFAIGARAEGERISRTAQPIPVPSLAAPRQQAWAMHDNIMMFLLGGSYAHAPELRVTEVVFSNLTSSISC